MTSALEEAFRVFIAFAFLLAMIFSFVDSYYHSDRLQYCNLTYGPDYNVYSSSEFSKVPNSCYVTYNNGDVGIKHVKQEPNYWFVIFLAGGVYYLVKRKKVKE